MKMREEVDALTVIGLNPVGVRCFRGWWRWSWRFPA